MDLVGSTAFKQKPRYPLRKPDKNSTSIGPEWLTPIASFYNGFTRKFAESWQDYVNKAEDISQNRTWDVGDTPEFWKGVGDELLFFQQVRQPEQIYGTAWAWVEALRHYRRKLKSEERGLDIKSSIWLAGFPVNNAEIFFPRAIPLVKGFSPPEAADQDVSHIERASKFYAAPRDRGGEFVRDFIGPSIDTGFRLGKFSTPRRLVVCIETAYFIAGLGPAPLNPPLKFFFHGHEELKGVLGGRPYPVCWIDVSEANDSLALAEDDLKGVRHAGNYEIMNYAEEFIADCDSHMLRPFVYGTDDRHLKHVPDFYEATVQRWRKSFEVLSRKVNGTPKKNITSTMDDVIRDIGRKGKRAKRR